MIQALFYFLAATAVLTASLCILSRNPMAAVLWLVGTMVSLAGIYVLLNAQFVAVIQVLVYAGAVMVLFLFVIMLLNLGRPGPTDIKGPIGLLIAVVLAGAMLFELRVLGQTTLPDAIRLPEGTVAAAQQQQGMVGTVAAPLFEAYLVPFEIASVLLLAAIVGAVVLAKRKL
jgi:NADH-quinone oxidoreductase subunit J